MEQALHLQQDALVEVIVARQHGCTFYRKATGGALDSRLRRAERNRGTRVSCNRPTEVHAVLRERFFKTLLFETMRMVVAQNAHSNSRSSVALSSAWTDDDRKQSGQVTTK